MKKRIISALLTSALILSLTACGADTETPDTTEGAEATTTAAVEEDTAEATTTTAPETEETTTTTEAPPVEAAKITTFSGLKNGYMAFSADNDKSYLYNIKDKTFTEIDSEYCTFQYGDGGLYAYATCITDSVAMIVTNPYENQCIGAVIDLSNGEIILEMNEDSDVYYAGQYNNITGDMLFIQKEESFEGNTIKFAVMNSKGEWLNDFSDSEVFYVGKDYWHGRPFDGNLLMYKEDGNGGFSYYIYSLENKTHTPVNLPSGYWTFYSYGLGDKLLLEPYSNNVPDYYYYDFWYLLDGQGEITPLEYNVLGLSDYGILTKEKKILDTETLEVIYDFSEYGERDYWFLEDYRGNVAIASPEERYAVELENPNGDRYIGIFDKSGNELVKPFKVEFSFWDSFFSGDYFVAYESFEGNAIANCATGEVKTYENTKDELGYYIKAFDEESGLMVVESDGYYYLVDPADPETLINPFEITE